MLFRVFRHFSSQCILLLFFLCYASRFLNWNFSKKINFNDDDDDDDDDDEELFLWYGWPTRDV